MTCHNHCEAKLMARDPFVHMCTPAVVVFAMRLQMDTLVLPALDAAAEGKRHRRRQKRQRRRVQEVKSTGALKMQEWKMQER